MTDSLVLPEGMLSVQDFRTSLATLEGLDFEVVHMDGTHGISVFNLPPGWNIGLKGKEDLELTDAKVGANGKEFQLTKGSVLAVTGAVGIPPSYVRKTPGPMIQAHLNYWAAHSPGLEIKMLVKGDEALAVTKKGIVPFSNLEILDRVVQKVCKFYNVTEEDLFVDPKSLHDLRISNLRIIVPSIGRSLKSARSEDDYWCAGVQVRNSLIGASPLTVQGYLFAMDGAYGAVCQHAAGRYNRRTMGQNTTEVYEWVEKATEDVLGSLEHEFDVIESLTGEDLESPSQVIVDVFKTYKVPLKVRQSILDYFVEEEDETYYGLVLSILQAATEEGTSEPHINTLMEVGADVARVGSQRCDACHRAFA